jgi:hypothetical protein
MTTKMRQLPITDLARVATMDPPLRRAALEQVKEGGGSGSYRPTREKLPDIVNRQPGIFESERAPWDVIKADLARLSKSDKEEKMNLRAGRAIYDYCVAEKVKARELTGYPLSFSVGLKLVCWSPALFVYPDRISIPFFDMRRKYGLTPRAARFMFSVMHIALRENNPDYDIVELEALRLSNTLSRAIQPISGNGLQLYSYDELEVMVAETHALWIEIQSGRRDDRRRSGDKWGRDSLFGD